MTSSTEDSWLEVAFRAYLDWRNINEPGVDTDTAWGTYVDNHTAKLEELKAAILQHEAASVKAARLDEIGKDIDLNFNISEAEDYKDGFDEAVRQVVATLDARLAELSPPAGKKQL